MDRTTIDLLQGTLGVLILKSVSREPLHGYGIARWIEQVTGDEVLIEDGSLYPALHRLQAMKLLTSEWGVSDTRPPRQALHHHRTGPRAAARGVEPMEPVFHGGDAGPRSPAVKKERRPWPSEIAQDVDEEIASHLELLRDEYAARGLAPGEAEAAADRKFGKREDVAEACRRDRPPLPRPGKVGQHVDGSSAGPRVRRAAVPPQSRIRRRRDPHPGARNGRDDDDLHAGQLGAAAAGARRHRSGERVSVFWVGQPAETRAISAMAGCPIRTWPTRASDSSR